MNKKGYFGDFGGSFVPEVLRPALDELGEVYARVKKDKKFHAEFKKFGRDLFLSTDATLFR
jgi:tryptophan synthase beta chain